MKLVLSNMMRMGKIHSRTHKGPVKLPEGPATMMNEVREKTLKVVMPTNLCSAITDKQQMPIAYIFAI